jgi:hypothetical protein
MSKKDKPAVHNGQVMKKQAKRIPQTPTLEGVINGILDSSKVGDQGALATVFFGSAFKETDRLTVEFYGMDTFSQFTSIISLSSNPIKCAIPKDAILAAKGSTDKVVLYCRDQTGSSNRLEFMVV